MLIVSLSSADLLKVAGNKDAIIEFLYKKAEEKLSPMIKFAITDITQPCAYHENLSMDIGLGIMISEQLEWRF